MREFEVRSPVLVTGATGYVAGGVIRELLSRGVTVRAAVRDPDNAAKLKYLNQLAAELPGEIEYFASDLLAEGSYDAAMAGCKVVFHTASPFALAVDDAQRDLVDPAVKGTRNVLESVNRTESVNRVVLTSSCAAIYGDLQDLEDYEGGRMTEANWNESSSVSHNPYSYSKAMAEKEAWKVAEAQSRWDLVAINPSLVIGPAVNPEASGESVRLMANFGDGTLKMGVPNLGMGCVNVREVAYAHVAAGFLPEARGRHIVSGYGTSLPEMAKILREQFGDAYPFPKKTLPKFLVWLVGPIVDKALPRKTVSRNVGYEWRQDNSKSKTELGVEYRPLEDSLRDFFQQLIDSGRFSNQAKRAA